ncbi:MAG TPA: hypothetical protein VNX25_03245 [Verrucomicrobiae bacterium]|nr:hypothetical protein [Verrucomicrobiae bacterium]
MNGSKAEGDVFTGPLTAEERQTRQACRFCLSERCDECCYRPEDVAEAEENAEKTAE